MKLSQVSVSYSSLPRKSKFFLASIHHPPKLCTPPSSILQNTVCRCMPNPMEANGIAAQCSGRANKHQDLCQCFTVCFAPGDNFNLQYFARESISLLLFGHLAMLLTLLTSGSFMYSFGAELMQFL